MSHWAHWSRGTEEKGKSFASFLKEDLPNTGNPSAAMGPAERAASLGLQSNGKGGYIDPNTGQVVARTVNNELIFYDSNRATGGAIADGDGGAALTQAQPSWADPLTGMLTTPPSKAETPSEIAAIPDPTPATAPFGYNAFMKRKKMAAYQQNAVDPQPSRVTPDEMEQGDADQQQAFAAEEALQEAPVKMGDALTRLKREKGVDPAGLQARISQAPPSPIKPYVEKARAQQQVQTQPTAPQVQQKNTQTPAQPSVVQPSLGLSGKKPQAPTPKQADTDGDGEVDLEEMRQAALNAYQGWTTKKKTVDDRMAEQFEPMMEALNRPGVNPQLRNRVMQTMMMALKYQGRDNEASSNISKPELDALVGRKDRLIRAYSGEGGDGSTHDLDSIREFQKEIQDQDLGDDFDELMEKAFGALPGVQYQKIFGGGDMSPLQGFKKFVRQHGKGGYTGLDLDPRTMQMEHFIDFNQASEVKKKAKSEGREMTPEEQELYDFVTGEDNQFWSRQGPNETKSKQNLKDFYATGIDPLSQLGEEYFNFRDMQMGPARLKLKGEEKSLINAMLERDEDGNSYLPEMDEEGFGALRETVDRVYSKEKDQLREALLQGLDPKGLTKLTTDKRFEKAVADSESDVSEEDRDMWKLLTKLNKTIGNYNHDFSRRLMESMGIKTGMTQTERSRSNPGSAEIYRALAPKFVGKTREEQKELRDSISEIFKNANSAANSQRGRGLGDKGIRQSLYQNLLTALYEKGLFTDDDYSNNKGLAKLRKQFLGEELDMSMFDIDEDGNFDMEDIMEIVSEILKMQEYNKPKKTFESFMG